MRLYRGRYNTGRKYIPGLENEEFGDRRAKASEVLLSELEGRNEFTLAEKREAYKTALLFLSCPYVIDLLKDIREIVKVRYRRQGYELVDNMFDLMDSYFGELRMSERLTLKALDKK